MTARVGDRISEYVLEEPLGRGGFGEVWRARHHLWEDRQVAIKIPVSPAAVRSLNQEAIIQAQLKHPAIAQTIGLDVGADPPYFITEFIPGTNLRERLRERGRLPAGEARDILLQVLDVLRYAHDHGVVHQDIKPENILINTQGRVVLTDFGLGQLQQAHALELSQSLRSADTAAGGTLAYLAPESRDGASDVDARADLYSLGVVLFEMVTGQRPAGFELPSELVHDLPRWCDEVFKGLYARRERRCPNAASVERLLAAEAAFHAPPAVIVTPLQPPRDQYLTQEETQRLLGLSRTELRHWVRRGKLEEVHVGNAARYPAAEVEKFRRQYAPVSIGSDQATKILPAAERAPASPLVAVRAAVAQRSAQLAGVEGDDEIVAGVAALAASAASRADPAASARRAGFFIRLVAAVVDIWAILLLSVSVIGPFWLLPVGPIAPPILLGVAYFTVCTALWGQTLGKRLLSLKVVRVDAAPLTALDALARTINYVISFLPLGCGFWAIAFTRSKRGLHDWLCGTLVVHDKPARVARHASQGSTV